MSRDFGDMTIKEAEDLTHFMVQMGHAVGAHGVVFYLDPDHVCDEDTVRSFVGNAPEMNTRELTLYFAWEEACLEMMKMSRRTFREQGYPVDLEHAKS